MHVTLVHVRVKPEAVDAFVAATRANHQGALDELGNRRFDVLQAPNDLTRFVLYEYACAADADAAAHKETAHYRVWRAAANR